MDDILDVLAKAGQFETLRRVLGSAGLSEQLSYPGPWTFFAPTDDAFDALAPGRVEGLMQDAERAHNVLSYHLVQGRYASERLTNVKSLKTVNGHRLRVETAQGLHVGKARIVERDLLAGNGIAHGIDTVLFPPV